MNIVQPILYQCRLNPGGPAICAPGSSVDMLSYAELEQAIHAVARRALALGLAPGDTVGLFIKGTILHAAIILGLTRLGVVTVSGRQGTIPKEVRLRGIVTDAPERFARLPNVIAANPDWLQQDAPPLDYDRLYRCKDEDVCRLILTSGTTGEPKATAFSHRILADRLATYSYAKGPRFARSTRLFCDLSIGTSPGFRYMVHALSRGGTAYFVGEDPTAILQALHLHQVETMMTSPYGLGEFLGFFEGDPSFDCHFDHIICQGAYLSPELSRRARARMCHHLYCSYGSTEVGTVALGPAHAISAIAGAVGYVNPGVSVEIVDVEDNPLPHEQLGAVRIRTPHAVKGYVGDPKATEAAFRHGCFYPGDSGYLTPDGLLVIVGREKTVLNVGGDSIKPETIEEIVAAAPGIADNAVLTLPNELGISVLVALVVSRSAINEEALQRHCAARLPVGLVPVRFVAVDAIPRGEQGKIERRRLAEIAKAKIDANA